MKKSIKKFCKDYVNLCAKQSEFNKKHWKGVALMNALPMVIIIGWTIHKQNQINRNYNDWLENN